jgi:hypothetical protein
MEGIIDLHHDLMFFLTIIIFFVLWLLINIVYNFYFFNDSLDNSSKSNSLVLVPSSSSVSMRISSKIHNTTQHFIVAPQASIGVGAAVGIVYGGGTVFTAGILF